MKLRDDYFVDLDELNNTFKVSDACRLESISLLNKIFDNSTKIQANSELDLCLVGLIVYFANKGSPKPLTLTEIAEASYVERVYFQRQFKVVSRLLGVRYLPSDCSQYIYRFASELKLSPISITVALDIIDRYKVVNPNFMAQPLTLTASALYISSRMNGEKRLQREVCDVVGVTEVSLRNTMRRIYDSIDL